tara:strand:+ start:189 stop:749 length:561 start_codon:yes stop_codon:yes gene_type:complete
MSYSSSSSSNICSWASQINNRNFLSGIGFKFNLGKFPKVDFFCNTARIPEITLDTTTQPSYLKNIDVPGEKISYGDLTIQFLVDENMENYKIVHDWITGLGFPETAQQFIDKTTDRDGLRDMKEQFADGTLRILNSNFNEVAKVKFLDMFPVSLSSLDFDATSTDVNYFTAQASFKYTVYQLTSSV